MYVGILYNIYFRRFFFAGQLWQTHHFGSKTLTEVYFWPHFLSPSRPNRKSLCVCHLQGPRGHVPHLHEDVQFRQWPPAGQHPNPALLNSLSLTLMDPVNLTHRLSVEHVVSFLWSKNQTFLLLLKEIKRDGSNRQCPLMSKTLWNANPNSTPLLNL